MTDKILLDVQYSEKDEAKSLGARWDPKVKRLYAVEDNEKLSNLINDIESEKHPEEVVKSLIKLQHVFAKDRKQRPALGVIYRGQSDYEWGLRSTYFRKYKKDITSYAFNQKVGSKNTQIAIKDGMPRCKSLDEYTKDRHDGKSSPLLDFSHDILKALFFACSNLDDSTDASLILYRHRDVDGRQITTSSPRVQLAHLGGYIEGEIHNRHTAQDSCYLLAWKENENDMHKKDFCHKNPILCSPHEFSGFSDSYFACNFKREIRIKKAHRSSIKKILDRDWKINEKTVMVEGVTKFSKRDLEEKHQKDIIKDATIA